MVTGGDTFTHNVATLKPIEIGATVVITHRVQLEKESQYDEWLDEIGPVCRISEGILDWQIIHPHVGLTATYTIILRFDTPENLQKWINSDQRKQLIAKVQPILATDDDFFIKSGLDFWFTPEGAKAKVPVRWKQFLVTWSAIYPLVLGVPLIILPLLRPLGIHQDHSRDTLLITGSEVSLMVYVVMPRYTKFVQRWLFR